MTVEEQIAKQLAVHELNERIVRGDIKITKRHVPNLLEDMTRAVTEQWQQKMHEQIYGSLPFPVYWDGPRVGRIQRWWWRAREWVGNVWHAIKGGTIADD